MKKRVATNPHLPAAVRALPDLGSYTHRSPTVTPHSLFFGFLFWCLRWDLNPQNAGFESATYANSVTKA